MWISHPGFEGEKNLGQEEDKAFQANGEVLKDKVSDAHRPDQIKEVKAVEVGLGKYEARRKRNDIQVNCSREVWCVHWVWENDKQQQGKRLMEETLWKKTKKKKTQNTHRTRPDKNRNPP